MIFKVFPKTCDLTNTNDDAELVPKFSNGVTPKVPTTTFDLTSTLGYVNYSVENA